jgi:hypothetical protein
MRRTEIFWLMSAARRRSARSSVFFGHTTAAARLPARSF